MRKKTTSNTGLASLLLRDGKKAGAVLRINICAKIATYAKPQNVTSKTKKN